MTSSLNTATRTILGLVFSDSNVCEKAKDMLTFYAETLATEGQRDIYDLAFEFAEPPSLNCQILEQWDGEDPELELEHFESIWEAMGARIFECNLEKLTNDTVRLYWDQLGMAIDAPTRT